MEPVALIRVLAKILAIKRRIAIISNENILIGKNLIKQQQQLSNLSRRIDAISQLPSQQEQVIQRGQISIEIGLIAREIKNNKSAVDKCNGELKRLWSEIGQLIFGMLRMRSSLKAHL